MAEYVALAENPEKLRKLFARLDCREDETGRQVAFNLLSAALSDGGIKWGDLLEAYLGKQSRPSRVKADSFADAFSASGSPFASAFADIFSHLRPDARPKPEPRQRAYKPIISGDDVPAMIRGFVTVDDRRPIRSGEMVVISVRDDDDQQYAPLVIFRSDLIDLLEKHPKGRFQVRTRPPSGPGQMPVVTSLALIP